MESKAVVPKIEKIRISSKWSSKSKNVDVDVVKLSDTEYELVMNKNKKLAVVTVKMKRELLEALDRFAINQRLTRSEIIREAIEEFLKKYGALNEGDKQ
ncbi:MAG: ribbon-helix-helix protein, CopG family [Thermofilum sp.]|uniref:ribbon-helix-helix domain-containing protein n=1 Tax=Thermofilum sp. TaxID=1961369 RepID=UPI00258AF754|nr:ribbon-helix-helix domain-containing protein [Thermofilum sp.]MCI4408462.1 ribbon-helix-helix protein, CopG family [Thermofilum sp.]